MQRFAKAKAPSGPQEQPAAPRSAPSSATLPAPPVPALDGIRVFSAASAILYGVETLRCLLPKPPNAEVGTVLTVIEERAGQIQRDLPDILRAAHYLAAPSPELPHPDAVLADALRCELDSLSLAQARCIHPTGWRHGRRPVPMRVARDVLRPILDVALATGRRKVLVQFHAHVPHGPWLTISWCLRAASKSRGAVEPEPRGPAADGPVPRLATLAASQLGCAWQRMATPPRRVRLVLAPRAATGPTPLRGEARPQAVSRVRAKATRPKAVSKALAKSSSVPKR